MPTRFIMSVVTSYFRTVTKTPLALRRVDISLAEATLLFLISTLPHLQLLSQNRVLTVTAKFSFGNISLQDAKHISKRRGVWTSLRNYRIFGMKYNRAPLTEEPPRSTPLETQENDRDRNTLTTVKNLRVHSFLPFISRQNKIPTNQIGALSARARVSQELCVRAPQVLRCI